MIVSLSAGSVWGKPGRRAGAIHPGAVWLAHRNVTKIVNYPLVLLQWVDGWLMELGPAGGTVSIREQQVV